MDHDCNDTQELGLKLTLVRESGLSPKTCAGVRGTSGGHYLMSLTLPLMISSIIEIGRKFTDWARVNSHFPQT